MEEQELRDAHMALTRRTVVNRSNASRSTGPKTTNGKTRSARNSLKHGLTATPPTLIGEDPSKWLQLLNGITESVKPQNFLEQLHVEDLAYQHLKRMRLREYETVNNLMIVHRGNHAQGQQQKLDELREDCERFNSLCKEWKELLQVIPSILNRASKESVTPGEASRLFESIVFLLEHRELSEQHYDSQLLSSAGYRMPDSTDTIFDDVDLFEAISWNRGMLNKGLKHIAETVKTSVKTLTDSLATKIAEKLKSYHQDYLDSTKELAELERDALKQNSGQIYKEIHADTSENRTIQRLESQSAKQLQLALQRIASLRALNMEPAPQPNLSVGVAISNGVNVAMTSRSANTTTEIDELSQLQSVDESTFESANLADHLSKEPVKVLS